MKTDLCGDDVVIHLTPQLLAAEGVNLSGSGGAASRAASAAVECGRRLLVAARAGDTDTVRELMAKGAPFTCDWLGTSPLHLAAANAKLETVQLLLRAGVSRDARTKVERTPLHLAAYAGHADCVNALIEGGAAVDAVDLLRMSALHWAVRRGHAAAARALLQAGADPTRQDKFLQTPLALAQRAAQAGSPDMLRLIEETLREREAAESVDALVSERTAEEAAMSTPSQPSTVRIQRISDTKMSTAKTSTPEQTQTKTTIKIDSSIPVTCAGAGAGAGLAGVGAGVAEALLRKHGITLLPADDGSTVLSALQSGRTVVLSDAGKLMLKESSSTTPIPEPLVSRAEAGVVLTATPVAAPPPGVKVFNLNSSAKVLAKEQKVPPVSLNRRIDKDKGDVQQVKLQLNASSSSNTTSPGGKSSPGGTNNSARPAVRIIMNKQNFRKLISTATKATFPDESQSALMEELADSDSEGSSESVVVVPEQFVRSSSPQYLRSQLLCAHAALHHVAGRLRRARAKLAACTRHRTH